ncbi:hypothetical protein M2138_002048, partial [Dysgonomonadaceae bacterium PH5-43]|nr:hypothetical protein [Dysgonomonadaceae bacterium PH5-43]
MVYSQEKQSQSFSLLEDKYEVPTPTSFPSNSKFDYYTRLDNYKEEQTLLYLNVPIMAQFQTTT